MSPEPGASGLTRFAWLSILAAAVTIALKASAWLLTGSVGLLSDALESGVNLVAAVVALVALTIAARPADDQHLYGHSKAEYFSAGVEGALILVAAGAIVVTAVPRLWHPERLEQVGAGLAVSVVAAALNGVVALILMRGGRRHRSITLTADGRHLMTDVWTTVGVVIGVTSVALTGWERLDPLVAIAVGINVLVSGGRLISSSIGGLMDTALPAGEQAAIEAVLERYRGEGARFHALRSRQAGAHRFVSVHVLVPGSWSVQAGHAFTERLEADVDEAVGGATVFTHLEPLEDPSAWADAGDHPESRRNHAVPGPP